MSNLATKSSFSDFTSGHEQDLLAEHLADTRSPNTRRAYAWDLKDFFLTATNSEPTPALLAEFLGMKRDTAVAVVLKYKSSLIERGLKEATVNRRLSAVRSLVSYARKVGKCEWGLQDVYGEKVQTYRDTSGVDKEDWVQVIAVPDRNTLKGKRDYALLRLLWDNVLRRDEICQLNIADYDPSRRTLWILGKGRGTQKQKVTLSVSGSEAITAWLADRGDCKQQDPLFIALDNACYGQRLGGSGLYYLVSTICSQAGIEKLMSPHRVRHSGITTALDATGGDARKVQRLSRHAKLDTLMIYDDNRRNQQGEVTDLLAAAAPGE
ncbi:xerC, integrase/recombinase XerC [Nostoc flagelliforme CCNUN1]|uniref:XerC, integrase/recombinase XerC n=1 Tax=Nostoc flagelliforme CCNUN1 TaxID=2038116 RepID=A0A2K8SL40_9NOSO|nr:tyrosine-type recombinase/integrase [Nostoc flagelliforme]AUB36127.1 xerC, integrase/recombinase XerC [Nostoc flagelliforme CCNUN1]